MPEPNEQTAKVMSLSQKVSALRDAFYAQHSVEAAKVAEAPSDDAYVEEVYDDHVIARASGKLWKVPFSETDDGIQFAARSDWAEVEQTYQTKAMPEFSMKALPGGRLAHYAVLWGGPETADLTPYVRNSPGEWFTPQTDELLNIYKAMGKLPWLYHHGGDEKVKTTVLGAVDLMGIDEWGIWYQTQLNKAEQYKTLVSHVTEMAKAGKLGSSSGTLPGAMKVAPTGEIKRWAIAEVSGTPAPMDPRMMERPFIEIKAAYKAIGLDFEQEETDPKGDEESRERDIELEKERLRLLEL